MSHQTVSRVVNGHPNVSPETRARVSAAMESLGYLPNVTARTLATGKSRTIGVICYDTTLYGPAATLLGIEEQAREEGYSVTIVNVERFDRRLVKDAVSQLTRHGVAGIAIMSPQAKVLGAFKDLPDTLPAVALWGALDSDISVVGVDEAEGARLATQHLLDLGHATVWHVAGPAGRVGPDERLRAWRRTLQEAKLEPPPILRGEWSVKSGFDGGVRLGADPEVTAIFAASDQVALGVLTGLRATGRRVPEDVSVVGFDDVPDAAYFYPPLTTVRQDFRELGRRSVAVLLEGVAGNTQLRAPTILPVELVVRKSTAAPRT